MKLTAVLAALMLAAAMAFAACGDDDDDDGGNGGGDQAEEAAAPGSARHLGGTRRQAPGRRNHRAWRHRDHTHGTDGKKAASAQLIRAEGGQSAKEVEKTYIEAGEGKPIPDWLRAEGGVGTTAPGETSTVTMELEEGTYYAVNDERQAVRQLGHRGVRRRE